MVWLQSRDPEFELQPGHLPFIEICHEAVSRAILFLLYSGEVVVSLLAKYVHLVRIVVNWFNRSSKPVQELWVGLPALLNMTLIELIFALKPQVSQLI